MSLPSDYASDDWHCLPDALSPPTRSQAHPLRSHSTEDLPSSISGGSTTTREIFRPDSVVIRPDSSVLRPDSVVFAQRRPLNTDRDFRTSQPLPSPPPTTYPAIRSASAERLGNSPAYQEFPVVPTRPPLRPTISFGGETRVSYYSISTDAASDLEKGSKTSAVEGALQHQHEQGATAEKRTWRSYISIALLCLLRLACGMSVTALSTVLPVIARDLHIDAANAFWIANSFLLASTVSQPLFMRLSYAFGGRLLLTIGIILCTAGSLACATAPNLTMLLFGRSLAGCGSGGLSVVTLLVLHKLTKRKDLSKCESCTTLIYWTGAALGPIVGGATAQYMGWHYMFWVTGAIFALSVPTLPFLLPLESDDGEDWQELFKVDYTGWIILGGSLTSYALAVSWAGTTYSWRSWHTVLPLVLGIVGLAMFAQYSRSRFRFRLHPILPIGILRSASALGSCFGTLVHGMIALATIYMAPILFQAAYDYDESRSGLLLASWTFALVASGAVTTALLEQTSHRVYVWAGWVLVTVGCGLMMVFRAETAVAVTILFGILGGSGLGLLLPSLQVATQCAATTDDENNHAIPLQTFFSSLGQTLGVATGSCILLNRFQTVMGNQTIDASGMASTYDAITLVDAVRNTAMDARVRLELISGYIGAMRWVWVKMCIAAGVALLLSMWYTEDVTPARRKTRTDTMYDTDGV